MVTMSVLWIPQLIVTHVHVKEQIDICYTFTPEIIASMQLCYSLGVLQHLKGMQ